MMQDMSHFFKDDVSLMNHIISLYLLVNNETYILTLLLIGLVLILLFSILHLGMG